MCRYRETEADLYIPDTFENVLKVEVRERPETTANVGTEKEQENRVSQNLVHRGKEYAER